MASKIRILALFFSLSLPAGSAVSADSEGLGQSAPLYLDVRLQSLRDAFYNLPTGETPAHFLEKEKILYHQGAYEKTVAAFHQIGEDSRTDLLPANLIDEAKYLAANSYLRMGEYTRAEVLFSSISGGGRYDLYSRYGLALSALYRYEGTQVVRHLTEVAEGGDRGKRSKDVEELQWKARATLGFFFLEQGQFPDALKAFFSIPPDNPFYPQALFGIGWAYARQGEWTRALVFWRDLAEKFPNNPYAREILLAIGQSYSRLSAYVKAAEAYGDSLRLFGEMRREVARWSDEMNALSGFPDATRMKKVEEIAGGVGVDLQDRFIQYRGLVGMEEYVSGIVVGMEEKQRATGEKATAEDLMIRERYREFLKRVQEVRRELWEDILPKITLGLEKRRESLLESSAIATVEIARNLRLANSGMPSGQGR
jgi:tetratricopeptide (TPR) repeat protein